MNAERLGGTSQREVWLRWRISLLLKPADAHPVVWMVIGKRSVDRQGVNLTLFCREAFVRDGKEPTCRAFQTDTGRYLK